MASTIVPTAVKPATSRWRATVGAELKAICFTNDATLACGANTSAPIT
ncbi:MAG TPA: hypothetical protein VOA64_17780 [Candidatus Dormibacteraeota bacterium]|nr:hypothetical protein [Candidatus Dormibacteraeota bacterium]